MVSRGQCEVGHNKNKSVNVEYKPHVPYPNATRKDRSDEQFGWETKQSPFKLVILATHQKLKEMSLKEVHESFSNNGRGPIHEEQMLQIKELDEWKTHKPRMHDKPELRQNKLNTFPHQLNVGDKVLLDVADPHIVTTTQNEEIPLTVLGIFPFGTVEVSHPKFGTFKVDNTSLKPYFDESDSRNEECKLHEQP
ncbi:hypothetical protein GOBAR_AA00152 [Gossypium barbadense]|uniref:Uncharacterized protein n=1 Tax=Gossypium barbadense TaxID=3634 RepID=A0A2P5YXX7_GOSBA|nr:hypothetical protein GOBAR_AA00152 [Gossypium barbadense]